MNGNELEQDNNLKKAICRAFLYFTDTKKIGIIV